MAHKEDIVKAAHGGSDDSGGSSDNSDCSGSESSEFGFGVQASSSRKKTAKREEPTPSPPPSVPTKDKPTKPKPSAGDSDKPEPKAPGPAPAKPNPKRQSNPKKSPRGDTVLENAQDVLKLLYQLSPEALWKGSIKAAEISNRLGKAQTCIQEIDVKAMTNGSPELEELKVKISPFLDMIPRSQELIQKVKGTKDAKDMAALLQQPEVASEMQEVLLYFCARASGEIMVAVLMHVGQKLFEAQGCGLWGVLIFLIVLVLVLVVSCLVL